MGGWGGGTCWFRYIECDSSQQIMMFFHWMLYKNYYDFLFLFRLFCCKNSQIKNSSQEQSQVLFKYTRTVFCWSLINHNYYKKRHEIQIGVRTQRFWMFWMGYRFQIFDCQWNNRLINMARDPRPLLKGRARMWIAKLLQNRWLCDCAQPQSIEMWNSSDNRMIRGATFGLWGIIIMLYICYIYYVIYHLSSRYIYHLS